MDTKKVGEIADRHRAEFKSRTDAREKKKAKQTRIRASAEQKVVEPWNALGRELKEFEAAYNTQVGSQGIYVEIYPGRIRARAESQKLEIYLNRQTGDVTGEIGHEPIDLKMVAAIGEDKLVWIFEGARVADPALVALALGKRLTDRAAGILREDG